ncbi:MAG TPA: hypothetical protein VM290_05465 [Gaiellaceae bacterium]|nr:hypothetical protein [Gaiellaceae bacterium]
MRAQTPAVIAAVALLAAAQGATAHEGKFGEGFRSTVSGIEPPQPGLLVEVIDGGELVSVRNWTNREVVLEGPDGEPLLRFSHEGVHEWREGEWRFLTRGTSHAWHDRRVHWSGPPPHESGHVADWRIPGTIDGERFVIEGFIGYTAPAPAARDGGISRPIVAAAAFAGVLAVAALALPLVRRKGEGARETRR